MRNLDKLWFRFSGNPTDDGFFIRDNHAWVGNEHMGSPSKRFNDLGFYRGLLEDPSCRSAEISSLKIRHNDYCHGIQTSYRVVSMDGSTRIVEGPENFYSSGYYAYRRRGGRREYWTHSDLYLRDNEHITGLSVRQGDILDAMVVVTNQRRVKFGGIGGVSYELGTPSLSSMKVIAFCGTVSGVCRRIGYYAMDLRWEHIGTHVLVRKLVQEGRANAFWDDVLSWTLTSLDEGVFRTVMGFLA